MENILLYRLKPAMLLVCFFTLSFSIKGSGQTFDFKTSEASGILRARDLSAHGLPDTITVWGNEFSFITSHLSTWGNTMKLKSNHSFVKFFVDNDYHCTQNPYTYQMTYRILGYYDPNDTTLYTSTDDTLTITSQNYHDPHNAYQDIQLAKYSGYYKTKVIITAIYDYNSGSPITANINDTLKWNFNVESSILTQRYDKQNAGTTYYGTGTSLQTTLVPHPSENYLNVFFNFSGGDTSQIQLTPVNYELEWTYIDDYQRDPSTGSVSHAGPSSLSYDFTNNCTRVWLNENHYRIPLVYPNGYIVYRMRMVRPDSTQYRYPVYSDWCYSMSNSGTVSSVNSACMYHIADAYMHDSLNWQYTISFAEGGKYKHVLGFYDGLLKNRESITRFNSNPNQLIVTRNIYDFEGQPSIKTLPAPVPSSNFSFLHNVDLNSATNLPYKAGDFDTGFSICPADVRVSPLASNALGNVYYSPMNPDTFGVQRFVADAQGYPFVQTIFSPGYTSRVDKQGGAGPRLQIADSNIISNYYAGSEQMPLNRIFGLNIGWNNFYQKTVTRDPNMQLSMSVKSYEGKLMATSMIGRGGSPVDHAIDAIGVPDSVYYHEDILDHVPQVIVGNDRTAFRNFYNEAEGNADLQYVFSFSPYQVCPSQYLSVKAHYNYQLTDQCGDTLYAEDSTIGVTGVVSSPLTFTGSTHTVHLGEADYSVHKDLYLNDEDIQAALDSFFAGPNCLLTEPYFLRKAVERYNFPCPSISTNPCEEKKQEMLAELHPGAKYGQYTGTGASIVGTSNSVFTYTHNGFRYQDSCTSFSLPNTITIQGVTYHNLRTMRIDSFIMLYNQSIGTDGSDPIAEALLPLHPEYCELLACFDDTFKTQLEAIPNAAIAESRHLLYLDSIYAHDPAATFLTSTLTSVHDSLTTYSGGHVRLDSMEFMIDYCSCGDSVMFSECVNHVFNYEITNHLLTDDRVKNEYFTHIVNIYLSNRQRFIDGEVSGAGNDCWHCKLARMTLIPDPVFTVGTVAGGVPAPSYMDSSWTGDSHASWLLTAFSSLPSLDSASDSTLLSLYDSVTILGSGADSLLCFGQVDTIVAHLSNCGNGDPALLAGIRNTLDSMCAAHVIHNGSYTPEMIRYAIVRNGGNIDDICNQYLVGYGSLTPPVTTGGSCKSDSFYHSVTGFLDDPAVIAALRSPGSEHAHTLNTTSSMFENNIEGVIGVANVKMTADYSAARSLYTLHIYSDPSFATTPDSVRIYLRGTGTCTMAFSGGDSAHVASVQCISTASYSAPGIIGDYSFVANVNNYSGTSVTSCALLGWTDTILTMAGKVNVIAECVPCTEMKRLYKEFTDSMNAYKMFGSDHPMYETMLLSFMNYKLGSMYSADQYETFIESCALADSMRMPLYFGYSTMQFSNKTDANTFISMLNAVDTNYDFNDDYRDSTAGAITVSIDFNTMNSYELWKYRNAIRNYSGPYTAKVVDTPFYKLYLGVAGGTPPSNLEVGFMYCPVGTSLPTASSVFGSGSGYAFVSLGTRGIWFTDHFALQDYYKIVYSSGTTPTPYSLSKAIYDLRSYIYNNNLSASFFNYYESTINEDYFKPRKQDYLRYTYSYSLLPSYDVIDSVQSDYLVARIPGYAGKEASYQQPFNPNVVTNLYVSDPSMLGRGYDTLKFILGVVADTNITNPHHIFFDSNRVPITYDSTMWAYRCSDGTYWYRYFGKGDTLWNVYVAMPPWVPQYMHKHYSILSAGIPVGIAPSLGDSTTRFFALNMRLDGGTDTIQARGMTTFVIGRNVEMDNVLLGNPMTTHDALPVTDTFHNCERDLLSSALREGHFNYNDYIDSATNAIRSGFASWFNDSISEHLYLGYINQEFGYTLYYYDRAGNLNATVPPAGVVPLDTSLLGNVNAVRGANYIDPSLLNAHKKVSTYFDNSYNQVVKQNTPDGGTVSFIYDAAGRLLFSQNDRQAPEGYCTYNLYDHQNRLFETGEAKLLCPYFDEYEIDLPLNLPDCYFSYPGTNPLWSTSIISPYSPVIRAASTMDHDSIIMYIHSIDRKDVVMTIFDTQAVNLGLLSGFVPQENLRKRVAVVKYFENLLALDSFFLTYNYATHYSYDAAGNVHTLVQDYPALESMRQRFKRVDYDYDLISGKVNMLSYNHSFADQYYQRYSYDDDNRITKVETSSDGYIWHRDAGYEYYQHGPLARTDVGDLRVQGIDYAYTIQGWLKAVNGDTLNTLLDMGGDAATTINAKDAVAHTIDYFKNDYKPITAWQMSHVPDATRNLYNGNIVRQTVAIGEFQRLHKQYVYDQLNRIRSANYAAVSAADNTLTALTDYHNNYSYDADGNLQTLIRYGNNAGSGAQIMDSLFYTYGAVSDGYTPNELKTLMDAAPDVYTNDIKMNVSGVPNYMYDAIGNTSKDLVSGQDTIQWNLYNKVTETHNVTESNWLDFDYDGAGNRVGKYFSTMTDTGTVEHNDYYVHDAQGNILAIYHEDEYYKKELISWIIDVLNPFWTHAAHRLIHEVVVPTFATDGNFQAQILSYGAASPDFKAVELDKPVSFFLHNPSLYQDMLSADASYIMPLVTYEQAGKDSIIGPALTRLLRNSSKDFSSMLSLLLNDSATRIEVLDLLCTSGCDAVMKTLVSKYGIDFNKFTKCSDWAGQIAANPKMVAVLPRDIPPLLLNKGVPVGNFMELLATDKLVYSQLPKYDLKGQYIGMLQSTLSRYGQKAALLAFFDDYQDAPKMLAHIATKKKLLRVCYNIDAEEFLNNMDSLMGNAYIDSSIAEVPTIAPHPFAEKLISASAATAAASFYTGLSTAMGSWATWGGTGSSSSGSSSGTLGSGAGSTGLGSATGGSTVISFFHMEEILKHLDFYLAEHDIYGSSRLGVKKYWPMQLGISWDNTTAVYDTLRLWERHPWYSAEYQDVIIDTALAPFSNTLLARYLTQHITGQKQYELTDHLGDVLTTLSDSRVGADSLGDSTVPLTISYYRPIVQSASDYYPFGMLMPGRNIADTSVHNTFITETMLMPVYYPIFHPTHMPYASTTSGSAYLTSALGGYEVLTTSAMGDGVSYTIGPLTTGVVQDIIIHTVSTDAYRAEVAQGTTVLATVPIYSGGFGGGSLTTLHFTPTDSFVTVSILDNSPFGGSSSIDLYGITTDSIIFTAQTGVVNISSDDQYHYGFNGQMKTNEIAGVGNHTTALFGEYDTRVSRRWNPDPKSNPSLSLYCVFGNNPISRSDVLLDTPATANQPGIPGTPGYVTPKVEIRVADAYSPSLKGMTPTSIWSIYGKKDYVNTGMIFDNGAVHPEDPDMSYNLEVRLGGDDSHLQLAFGGSKQKFSAGSNGVGYEAPSATYGGLGYDNRLFSIGKKISFNANVLIGAGPEVGSPRSTNANLTPSNAHGYTLIGVGATSIGRVDATFTNRFSIFAALTAHHAIFFDQMTTQGTTLKGNSAGSISITAGVGYNMGLK